MINVENKRGSLLFATLKNETFWRDFPTLWLLWSWRELEVEYYTLQNSNAVSLHNSPSRASNFRNCPKGREQQRFTRRRWWQVLAWKVASRDFVVNSVFSHHDFCKGFPWTSSSITYSTKNSRDDTFACHRGKENLSTLLRCAGDTLSFKTLPDLLDNPITYVLSLLGYKRTPSCHVNLLWSCYSHQCVSSSKKYRVSQQDLFTYNNTDIF